MPAEKSQRKIKVGSEFSQGSGAILLLPSKGGTAYERLYHRNERPDQTLRGTGQRLQPGSPCAKGPHLRPPGAQRGNEKGILPRIGSLIESPGFYPNLTGTENLQIFARLRGLKSPNYIKSALELVNLPYRDKKRYAQYSLGMKQRLAIALAVMHDPELLILDEPINGLDPIGIAEVRDFIRALCDERGKTILISSHILSEIALLADDIGIIDHGVLLEEESLAELEQKNGKVLRFTVSNAPVAAQLLQQEMGVKAVTVENERELTVRDLRLDTGAAVRRFVEAGLVVSDAHL